MATVTGGMGKGAQYYTWVVRYTQRKDNIGVAFKHRLHHWYTVVRRLKAWQLAIVLVLLMALSTFLMRQNNLEMIRLRTAVEQADQQNADLPKALLALQHYVSSHMNTNLGDGIALQYSYQRAYEAAVQSAASSTNPQAAVYTQVEMECRPVFQRTGSFPAYTQCAHDRLSQLAPGQDALSALKTPSPDLFKVNYTSSAWSPDAAGFAVALTIIVALMLIGRMAAYLILRAFLHAHQ
jgi:hypothetical protein